MYKHKIWCLIRTLEISLSIFYLYSPFSVTHFISKQIEDRGLATNLWLCDQSFLHYIAALKSLELNEVLGLFLRIKKKVMLMGPLKMVMHFTS